jgi:Cft2 family RNA processing exonuclease
MFNHIRLLLIGMIFPTVAFIDNPISYAEKRECKDLAREAKYNSEDHDDNKESEKAFKNSLKQDSLCEFT